MADAGSDAAARERALAIDRSILLEAPAGSGKTSVLTQRLLALLAIVDEPEEVLAITFTRKAAAEMRLRVLAALTGEIDPRHPQAALMAELAARVHARSAERGWRLDAHASRLRILTIDAFNMSLAAQRPLAAGAAPGLTIADRPDELYQRAARQALLDGETEPDLESDLDLLFQRLDNQWGRVEALLADMLARRAHWLPHVLESATGDLRARIDASLSRIVADQLAHNVAALPAAFLADAARLPGVGSLGASVGDLEAWRALANATLTASGTLRKRVDKRVGPGYEDPAHKERLKALIGVLDSLPTGERMMCDTRQLPPAALSPDDGLGIDALARVLTWAARHLQLVFAGAGRVDHVHVAGAARAALTEEGRASDLAIRTGLTLRHILVDEFQDTSIAQFALLEALVQDWAPGDGRTLFVVGDPMQSIYQFREAEVGLFLRARDFGIGPVRFDALRLSRNFRSRPALVGFANALCGRIFPAHDDIRAAAVRHMPSDAAREPGGESTPVSLLAIADGSGDDEAQAVVRQVNALRASGASGSIAILVLARAHAVPISTRLAAAGHAVRGVDLVPLAEVPVVRDLVALLRALAHAGDRTAWLAALRAPWCGLTLASLGTLSRRRDALLIGEAIRTPERLEKLPADEATRLARFTAALEPAIDRYGRESPGQLLESLWLELGGADCYALADLDAARELFRTLDSAWARGEWHGIASLDGLLADLHARSGAGEGAIEIMTIHRAKGLEFDHVILPGFGRRLRRDDEPLLRWLDLPREGAESDLLMSPIVATGERTDHLLGAYLKALDAERHACEQLRLLYVAVTRAKESLHWIAGVPLAANGDLQPGSGTLLAAAWPALADAFVTTHPDRAVTEEVPALAGIARLPATWQPRRPADLVAPAGLRIGREAAELPEFSWVRETARHIGTAVHRALERWGRALPSTLADLDREEPRHRAMLERLGVPHADLDAATATVVRALRQTFEDERGRWLFAPEHREAATELALSGIVDGRLVNVLIDRTFIDRHGTRWVIDYKTSRHEGGALDEFLAQEEERYRPQLARYVKLAQGLGPQPVRAALYFPLIGAFRSCQ